MIIDVRSKNLDLTPAERAHAEHSLSAALDRFAPRIDQVRVSIADVNGPKGGIDKACRVQVHGRSGWEVLVSQADADVFALIDRASQRAGQAVARLLDRAHDESTRGARA